MGSYNVKDTSKNLEGLVPYEIYPFASYLEGRAEGRQDGEYKRHKTLPHAKNAINPHWRRGAKRAIYKWDDYELKWVEIDKQGIPVPPVFATVIN